MKKVEMKINESSDVLGRVVYQTRLEEGANNLRINTTEWNKGVYLYVLLSNEQIVDSGKMILIR
jgi:hypothetical protein